MSEEELDIIDDMGGGIWSDDEAVETLRKSAQALGINPDLVAPEANEDGDPQYKYYSNKACKRCYGRGVLHVCISPSKQKLFWQNEGLPGRIPKRKATSVKKQKRRARKRHKDPAIRVSGPTQPRRKAINSVSIGNESDWNTRQPEPEDFKVDNLSRSFCHCIRAVEV